MLLAFLEFGLVNWLNRRDEAKKRIQEAAEEKARQEEEERLNVRGETSRIMCVIRSDRPNLKGEIGSIMCVICSNPNLIRL